MSNFTIETFTTKTNKVDLVDAAHINTVQTSIVTIETALNIAIQQNGTLNQGTSFPGSPLTGQLFYRTDLNQIYVWSGSGWSAVSAISNIQIFTSSGTFTAPTGITKVYITMIGGGGSGAGTINTGGSQEGGGGACGNWIMNYPYTVVSGNNYTVTIGAKGAGVSGSAGNNGGSTSFDTITVGGGNHGSTGHPGAGGLASGGYTPNGATAGSFGFPSITGATGTSGSNGGGGAGSPFGVGGNGYASTTGDGLSAPTSNTGAAGGGARTNNSAQQGGDGSSGFVMVAY